MKLSIEFTNLIKQSLFDRYAIEDLSMQQEDQKGFIRFSLKGRIYQEPFVGSLNIAENKDKTYSFTMTGWFEDKQRSFMKYLLMDNVYINAISEVEDFLSSNFGRHITTILGRFHIGTGEFSLNGKKFTDVSINANPTFRSRLEIVLEEKDTFIPTILLEYAYVIKDGHSNFSYTDVDHNFYLSLDDQDIEALKKILIREYMVAYSTITSTPNVLSIDEFNTLSYQHILDYLTVQHMKDIH